MKYKINKNSVEETLIIPLYSRKKASELYPNLYKDETSKNIIDNIDYDFSNIDKTSNKLMYRFGYLEVLCRQNDLGYEIKEYLNDNPNASIVNLGCGLDDLGNKYVNKGCIVYNIDFKDVIDVRNKLLSPKEKEKNIASDIKDTSWFNKIDFTNGAIFFASGVFYYFLSSEIKDLLIKMSEYFKGCVLVFDAANKFAAKLIKKTWLKKANIKNVDAYFYVSNAYKQLSNWSSNIKVSSKGYMLGYNNLNDKSVSPFFRFLSKVGDNLMKMQIVKIEFK